MYPSRPQVRLVRAVLCAHAVAPTETLQGRTLPVEVSLRCTKPINSNARRATVVKLFFIVRKTNTAGGVASSAVVIAETHCIIQIRGDGLVTKFNLRHAGVIEMFTFGNYSTLTEAYNAGWVWSSVAWVIVLFILQKLEYVHLGKCSRCGNKIRCYCGL